MGFYYFSLLSMFPLAVAYVLLLLVFWGIARLIRELPARKVILVIVGAAFLILPVAEELWIAWNFGQACKEAGTFVYKKVQVEGYYDDSAGGTMTRLVGRPSYQFIESRDSSGKYRRIEHASSEEKTRAIASYLEKNMGRKPGAKEWITQLVNERLQIVVEMETGNAWRISELDRPTARYHFRTVDSGTPSAHKIVKSQTVVIDVEKNEQIARYTRFGRRPAWFFIGLDTPAFACDAPGQWPLTKNTLLVYRDVLIPSMR